MKSTHFKNLAPIARLLNWKLAALLVTLCAAGEVLAQVPVYVNNEPSYYLDPGSPAVPQINAIAFDNENVFSITYYNVVGNNQVQLFEPWWYTMFYTNNSTMIINADFYGAGYQFDTQAGNSNVMAGTFYNPGTIRCDSVIDGNSQASIGECYVLATNVIIPGTIDVGINGVLDLTGRNMDLTRTVLTIEGVNQGIVTNFSGVDSLDYGVGTDNNADWNPATALTATSAKSSDFNSQLFNDTTMTVNPSIPYYEVSQSNSLYQITRAVFITSDPGVDVMQNIYFGGHPTNIFIGNGAVTVQWSGAYIDPVTGLQATNYLYLNDIYIRGANTNNTINPPGIPSNFTLSESHSPAIFSVQPENSSFPTYVSGVVTNDYTYALLEFLPTTVSTNNPSNYVTNYLALMAGRIQINSADLNLSRAIINGPNYLSLTAGTQFNGSQGATISSPYNDFNLAVTNGSMTISNLLEPTLADWDGTLQAWTADWYYVDPITGGTNDNRVLLINANLSPTTPSQVQNLQLSFAPNSLDSSNLVISDVLNVFGSFNANAKSLTLTTNGIGATSPDGELNISSSQVYWQDAVPNLIGLTNYGAIRLVNAATFGSSSAWYQALLNYSLISDEGSQIWASNFVSGGGFDNGVGPFTLVSKTALFTNGYLFAGGNISITANSLVTSNLLLYTYGSLTLQATNELTDTGVTSGNMWLVGNPDGTGGNGVVMQAKPASGDLLGTFIYNYAPAPNKLTSWTWAGRDFGASTAGYTNNVAVGGLVLDALGNNSTFSFNGTGTSNAIYVDYLEFLDSLTNGIYNSYDFSQWLTINTNMVIYFAQAVADGVSIAEKINEASLQGKNGGVISNGVVITPGRLRWVPMYAGHFSSTYIVYNGVTYPINAALAGSPDLDSNGNNVPNAFDPSPIFVSGQVNFKMAITNLPPKVALLQWNSIPSATNIVMTATNLLAPNWVVLTNFVSPATAPPVGGWPITNTMTTAISNNPPAPQFYRVLVYPNNEDLYGF
jgi:hypothetical protein